MRSPFPFLDVEGTIAFAHRGGAKGGLENSMTAFQRAVDLGYRYLETDARATADGVLLAFHDATLDRVTDRSGSVRELPWREVRAALIGGSEPIPTLEDVLGAWPHVRVNIDVKDVPAIGPLIEVIRRTGTVDRVCVGSFSERRLRAVRAALGERLATSFGPAAAARLVASTGPGPAGWLLSRLAPAGILCLQVPPQVGRLRVVTPRLVHTAHSRGVAVHVWTVDDPTEITRLLDLGVDGIMTDELDALRGLLRARGQWPS